MSEEKLTQKEKEFLLDFARRTIARKLKIEDSTETTESDAVTIGPHISEKRGCFVTIHKKGQLRGCIGMFEANGPLWRMIEEMAIQAAFHDPRFSPLKSGEVKDIDIEISVLSPLRKIKNMDEIKVGEHGIYITKGFNRGVLLPQVATEYGWDRETFLDHTCAKAGLSAGCWKKTDAIIEIFSAEVFGEKKSDGAHGCS